MSVPSDQSPESSRSQVSFLSRRGKMLLVISLAINLLVAGALAGAAFLHKRHGGRFEPVFAGAVMSPGEFFGFMRTLPAERRKAIRQAVIGERPKVQQLKANLKEVQRHLEALIVADPLDQAALDEANKRLWTAEGELRRMQLSLTSTMIALMSRQEREQLIAWRQSRGPMRGERGGGEVGEADAGGKPPR